ncbi:SGNH/GDSL hydrolase family protein [Acidovorax sp. sic0104]|uniref:SGNH/GDSL hydrolase family protein n=1 Tax=Acidovorax sp. sic0104 TaxID=2854784 RepID=UPI001C45A480|nr:SGNH/GDSL hydrolase family protein [Acidovorax sp. sic0104]MBV7540648.1 SGNH/GDSL hydrolase family protein [Acidovorax sp. sic0104]
MALPMVARAQGAPVIARKIAVYTDSFGDGGNPLGRPKRTVSGGFGFNSQYSTWESYGNASNQFNMARRISAAVPGSSYDAQQFGGSTLVGMTDGYRPDLNTNALVPAFGGLTLVQHAIAIQADQVVIHLGGNDALSPADRTAVSAYWFSQLIGKPLAQNGTRLAIVEAPYPVPEDTFGPTDPTTGAYADFVGRRDSLNSGIDAAVAEINAHYPGFATRVRYWSNGAVAMNPGTTHEGLHPTLVTHMAIASAVAAQVRAFRGW